MRYISCLTILLVFAFVPQEASGQFGPYADEGFGIGAGVSSSDNATTFGGSAGYLITPAVEIGVGVSRTDPDNVDITTTGVGPYAAIYPVRQGERFPLSVAISGSYTFQSFSGDQVDTFEDQGGDISGSAINVEGGIFRSIEASDFFEVIPYAGVGYTRNKTELSAGGQTESETETTSYFSLSASLLFKSSDTSYFAVTPSASFSDDASSFGISASIVIPE